MEQNSMLYGLVEIDKLRHGWEAREFPIQVPTAIVQSGLLPSIFDWPLLGQLMPSEQTAGISLLQERINNLELLNNLTTSLQRIQILPETELGVDLVIGRPSYNVLVRGDGSIMVNELPSLHIHVFGTETRAAAGQESTLAIQCAAGMGEAAAAAAAKAKAKAEQPLTEVPPAEAIAGGDKQQQRRQRRRHRQSLWLRISNWLSNHLPRLEPFS
ncbi:uncharacterized protein LOC108605950 [Drosophila busckii]|uniref:uncharacterized protein LOC108605950 n=1 Tax=Drosophila busckii TaxID=30019 RepID=UPI00083F14FD|nr:uncharacterized protein LOC108605950 [Drosophila busckii]